MKICAFVFVSIAANVANLAIGGELAKAKGETRSFVDGGDTDTAYNIMCPQFTIIATDSGYLEYCNAYRTSCNDIPDVGYALFMPEPQPCDCPDSSGCQTAFGNNALYDAVKPLPRKVPNDGQIPGLNKSIVMCKSIPGYFMNDGEPVYVRVMEMAYINKEAPEKTCSFTLGLEMKSPLTGVEGLQELKNVKPTNMPFVFTIQRPSQTILVIRALGVSNGSDQQPKLAKTSANKADQ